MSRFLGNWTSCCEVAKKGSDGPGKKPHKFDARKDKKGAVICSGAKGMDRNWLISKPVQGQKRKLDIVWKKEENGSEGGEVYWSRKMPHQEQEDLGPTQS